MKNYQKLNYHNYYAQNQDGEYVAVSRRECFAPPEAPTDKIPFKQRWYYDPEAGYAVRLARTAEGDALGRRNDADLKSDERYQARKFQCIWKHTNRCNQDCDHCDLRVSRTIELDKPFFDEDGNSESQLELVDKSIDFVSVVENEELLSALASALDKLDGNELKLWEFLTRKTTKQAIADYFNLTLDGVRYREQRLYVKLRSNKALKNFFEES